jgi:hypothetical protein
MNPGTYRGFAGVFRQTVMCSSLLRRLGRRFDRLRAGFRRVEGYGKGQRGEAGGDAGDQVNGEPGLAQRKDLAKRRAGMPGA